MKGFFKVQTRDELFRKMDRFRALSFEGVKIEDALHRALYEDVISQAKSMISADAWDKAYPEGQKISLDQAITLATQALKR